MNDRGYFLGNIGFSRPGLAPLAFASSDSAPTAPRDELQSWISKTLSAYARLIPVDEDFKDLEFSLDVIGAAQVVQLGKPVTPVATASRRSPGS